MKRIFLIPRLVYCTTLFLLAFSLPACTAVDLNTPVPTFETSVDPDTWVTIPAGEFQSGQHNEPLAIDYDYEIMVTDVTVFQYVTYLNAALNDGRLKIEGERLSAFIPATSSTVPSTRSK